MQNLPDLQKRMLVAARSEASGIYVTKVGDDVVVVRAGDERWYGRPAVNAAMVLMVQGYLTRVGNRFELTELGMRTARTLRGSQPPEAAPAPSKRAAACPRCRKTLRPGQLRCAACGARVPAAVATDRPAPGREPSV